MWPTRVVFPWSSVSLKPLVGCKSFALFGNEKREGQSPWLYSWSVWYSSKRRVGWKLDTLVEKQRWIGWYHMINLLMPSIIFIRVTVQYKRKQDGRPLYRAAGSHGLLCSADSSSCSSLSPSGTNMILRALWLVCERVEGSHLVKKHNREISKITSDLSPCSADWRCLLVLQHSHSGTKHDSQWPEHCEGSVIGLCDWSVNEQGVGEQSVTSRLETSWYRDFSQFFESIGIGLENI